MTVFLDQPVSSRRAAVSSVMVRGEASQSLFMSFHSPSDRCTFMAGSSLRYLFGLGKVYCCLLLDGTMIAEGYTDVNHEMVTIW